MKGRMTARSLGRSYSIEKNRELRKVWINICGVQVRFHDEYRLIHKIISLNLIFRSYLASGQLYLGIMSSPLVSGKK